MIIRNLSNEDNFSKIMEETKKLAFFMHKDQKYGKHDFSVHLDGVHSEVDRLYDFPEFTEKELEILHIGAYLHDILEDTSLSSAAIYNIYGNEDLMNTIILVTDVNYCPETGRLLNRKEKHRLTYPKIAESAENGNDLPLALKLADRISNVKFSKIQNPKIFNIYSNEYEYFRNILFNVSTKRLENAWKILDNIFLTF